jgi:ElaB/YqjD/DUF883 family membrane-anchored ribosome-binding protein
MEFFRTYINAAAEWTISSGRAGMDTASTASNNAGETAKDAREAVGEAGQAASEFAGSLEKDLEALRDDFRRLAEQVADIVGRTGNAAWGRAKASIDDAVSDAQDKGRDAANAVREVSDHFVDALDESIKTRPYTTLALVAGLAFLVGATWRR